MVVIVGAAAAAANGGEQGSRGGLRATGRSEAVSLRCDRRGRDENGASIRAGRWGGCRAGDDYEYRWRRTWEAQCAMIPKQREAGARICEVSVAQAEHAVGQHFEVAAVCNGPQADQENLLCIEGCSQSRATWNKAADSYPIILLKYLN